jgi:hypothetical protein
VKRNFGNQLTNQIMKKLLGIVLILAVAFSGCKKSTESPESVAKKFLDHLNKKEYAEAKALGTEATGQIISMMESMQGMAGGEAEMPEVVYEDMKAEVDGEKALVTYTVEGKEEKLNMVLVEGKWLVDMKKEGMGEEPEPEIEEVEEDTMAVDVEAEAAPEAEEVVE